MSTDDPRDLFPPLPEPGQPVPEPAAAPAGGAADEPWAAAKPAKGVRLPIPVLVALVAIVALVGLWGGAQLKGDNATAASTTGTGGRQRGYFNGGNGGNGQGGGFGVRGTFGTVESVSGDTITLKANDGSTVTVKLSSSTTVSKSATASVGDIAPGDTLVVRGTTTNGATDATAITIGQPGAGFPGGFGPGGQGGQGGPPGDATQTPPAN